MILPSLPFKSFHDYENKIEKENKKDYHSSENLRKQMHLALTFMESLFWSQNWLL